MKSQRTVFSQLLDFIPKKTFERCVRRYRGNHNVRSFSCWDQFLCMAFAQLTNRESLRDIEICLRNVSNKLYKVGLRGSVSRSTLADANNNRDSRIYADFCRALMKQARKLYAHDRFIETIDEAVYVLDTTHIRLCLSLFPWAKFSDKPGIKVHTLLDLRGPIPSFIAVTSPKYRDNKMLDNIPIEPGAFYIMDKAYVDFARLNNIHQACGYFVTRPKTNIVYQRVRSHQCNPLTGIYADHTVLLTGQIASRKYKDQLRRIRYKDPVTRKNLTFITNNFYLPPDSIAELYKARWQIEIFFRWIKQHLRIKQFYGNSSNAVETQIWIAVSVFLLVAIAKKKFNSSLPLYQILQLLNFSLFEEMPIFQAFDTIQTSEFSCYADKQLILL